MIISQRVDGFVRYARLIIWLDWKQNTSRGGAIVSDPRFGQASAWQGAFGKAKTQPSPSARSVTIGYLYMCGDIIAYIRANSV